MLPTQECGESLAGLKREVLRLTAIRDDRRKRLARLTDQVAIDEKRERVLAMVSTLFRHLLDQEVTEGIRSVEELLTKGLQSIFSDQDLRVRADIDVQRGKVSATLVTIHDRPEGFVVEGESEDSFGGAVATIESILLRIVVIKRSGLRPILLLDETLPAIDRHYVHNVGVFLSHLARDLGIPILAVTHDVALAEAADHAYRMVSTEDGAILEKVR